MANGVRKSVNAGPKSFFYDAIKYNRHKIKIVNIQKDNRHFEKRQPAACFFILFFLFLAVFFGYVCFLSFFAFKRQRERLLFYAGGIYLGEHI
jgi:hypothetical protein